MSDLRSTPFNADTFPVYFTAFGPHLKEMFPYKKPNTVTVQDMFNYFKFVSESVGVYKLVMHNRKLTDEFIASVLAQYAGRAVFLYGEFCFLDEANYMDAFAKYSK